MYKRQKYALSDIDFSIAEIVSLYFTEQVLKTYRSLGMAKDALTIIRRILDKLPGLSRSAIENVKKMIKIVPEAGDDPADEEVLALVQEALEASRSLRLTLSLIHICAGPLNSAPIS